MQGLDNGGKPCIPFIHLLRKRSGNVGRVLKDDESYAVWACLHEPNIFGSCLICLNEAGWGSVPGAGRRSVLIRDGMWRQARAFWIASSILMHARSLGGWNITRVSLSWRQSADTSSGVISWVTWASYSYCWSSSRLFTLVSSSFASEQGQLLLWHMVIAVLEWYSVT